MADDFIKRFDAINAYKGSCLKDNHRTVEASLIHTQEHNHILHILDKLPAADVVEVVRCKDCKCYELMTASNQYFCNKYGGCVNENDYCSRYERRSENARP